MSAILSAVLGLYLGHAQGLDPASAQVAQREMQRLLAPAGIQPVWNNTSETPSLIVVGSFEGSCSVDSLKAVPYRSGTATLADTTVSVSRVLPYFRVDCDNLIRTLTPMLEPLSLPLRRAVFGRALARVMTHELYHILAQSTGHDKSGVAKPSFSLDDLTGRHFDFESVTLDRMRPPSTLASMH